jgi:hypothetical protein
MWSGNVGYLGNGLDSSGIEFASGFADVRRNPGRRILSALFTVVSASSYIVIVGVNNNRSSIIDHQLASLIEDLLP